jgi:hypothetical protein
VASVTTVCGCMRAGAAESPNRLPCFINTTFEKQIYTRWCCIDRLNRHAKPVKSSRQNRLRRLRLMYFACRGIVESASGKIGGGNFEYANRCYLRSLDSEHLSGARSCSACFVDGFLRQPGWPGVPHMPDRHSGAVPKSRERWATRLRQGRPTDSYMPPNNRHGTV